MLPAVTIQLMRTRHDVANADKRVLFSACDGPESIEIYTSENEGVIDWSRSFPALYLSASTDGASVKLGPFQLPKVYEDVLRAADRQAHSKQQAAPLTHSSNTRLASDMLN